MGRSKKKPPPDRPVLSEASTIREHVCYACVQSKHNECTGTWQRFWFNGPHLTYLDEFWKCTCKKHKEK